MFRKVLFRCENIGREDDFTHFWHFLTWIRSFLKPIEFLGPNKVNLVEKRLKSCEKMSKICKIILTADVFTTKQNLGKHSTVRNDENSLYWCYQWSNCLCLKLENFCFAGAYQCGKYAYPPADRFSVGTYCRNYDAQWNYRCWGNSKLLFLHLHWQKPVEFSCTNSLPIRREGAPACLDFSFEAT